MTILRIKTPDELSDVAERILEKALADPHRRALMEQLAEDQQANRRELIVIAFSMGAASALGEMMQGHVVQIGSSPSQSDS